MKLLRKSKLIVEQVVKSSPSVLYNMLVTPSGLSSWFCDDVDIKHDSRYVFFWGSFSNEAKLVAQKKDHYVRFVWEKDISPEAYFEFKIEKDYITSDVFLIITSTSEIGNQEIEEEDWEHMARKLKNCIGG
jgi:uncharacterized protein YndB with AHSA1/START domain